MARPVSFVQRFVAGCAICQSTKINTHSTVPGLFPLSVEFLLLFQSISVDLITGLPLSEGFDSILVVVDHSLTKGVNFLHCPTIIDTAGVAQLVFKYVFSWFRLHSKCISDRGTQFASAFA